MTEYIFHIGPHKTGSTYLQNTFCALRSELAQKGVTYPTRWQTFLTGHHALAAELRTKKLDSLRSGFDELSSERTVVFSSEEFSLLEQSSLTLLKDLIGNNKLRIIFYTRRWSELLPSCWQEEVKQGSSDTLPDFYVPRLADPLKSNILNFNLVLDRFSSVFGTEDISIVSYSNLRDKGVDLFRHFLSEVLHLNVDDFPFTAPTFPNVSLDYVDIEIIRALNSLAQKLNNTRSAVVRDLYLRKKPVLDLKHISEQIDADRARISINDGAYALDCLFSYVNEKYKNNIIGGDKTIFSQLKGKPYVYARMGYLLIDGVADALRKLYAELIESKRTRLED